MTKKKQEGIQKLRARLAEAEETLRAIRNGEVDAIVVSGPRGEQIFSLKDAEHAYRVLVESMNEGAATLSPEGYVLYGNQRLAEILGIRLEKLLGASLEKNISQADLAAYRNLLEQGRIKDKRIELTLQSGSGVQVPVCISARSLQGDGQNGVSLVVTDISEIKKSESALQQEQKLRQQTEVELQHARKLEAVGQLAAGIAHEINTPTQYVGDNLQFIQDSFQEVCKLFKILGPLLEPADHPVDMGELLQTVKSRLQSMDIEYMCSEIPKAIAQSLEGVKRVCGIVHAMKSFAHKDLDRNKKIAQLNELIQNTVIITRNIWKHVAELQTELAENLPPVNCLPDEINQVILNLIVNAAHAIEAKPGGQGQKGLITIISRQYPEGVEVIFKDNGIGIPSENREKIFEPFFTTKEVGKGTGQGLAIAYGVVVKKHQGQLTFESEVGHGTTFYMKLPLGLEPASDVHSAAKK